MRRDKLTGNEIKLQRFVYAGAPQFQESQNVKTDLENKKENTMQTIKGISKNFFENVFQNVYKIRFINKDQYIYYF